MNIVLIQNFKDTSCVFQVVTPRTGRQELWVSTASFQRYMSGTLHPNETNFRIQAGFIDELVRGTQCDVNALDIAQERLRQQLTTK